MHAFRARRILRRVIHLVLSCRAQHQAELKRWRSKELTMLRCRLASLPAIAAVMIGFVLELGLPQHALAQKPVITQSIDPFGQEVKLTAKPIVYVAGSGTWDKAYDTLIEAFKKAEAYRAGAGFKASGPAMTIYTATDDTGF